jgi:hypothetical protein
MTTIGEMTLDQLKHVIRQEVNQMLSEDDRLRQLFGESEMDEDEFFGKEPEELRSVEEVLAAIERDQWTPPPGAKSSLELLREDRDRS